MCLPREGSTIFNVAPTPLQPPKLPEVPPNNASAGTLNKQMTWDDNELPVGCIHPSIHPSIHLSILSFICLFFHPSVYLSIHLSILPSIFLSFHPSVYSSIHPFIHLAIHTPPLSYIRPPTHSDSHPTSPPPPLPGPARHTHST